MDDSLRVKKTVSIVYTDFFSSTVKMIGIRIRILMIVIVAFAAALLRASEFTNPSQNETVVEISDVNGEVEKYLMHFFVLIAGMAILLLIVGFM